jgi:hypothetical protein
VRRDLAGHDVEVAHAVDARPFLVRRKRTAEPVAGLVDEMDLRCVRGRLISRALRAAMSSSDSANASSRCGP